MAEFTVTISATVPAPPAAATLSVAFSGDLLGASVAQATQNGIRQVYSSKPASLMASAALCGLENGVLSPPSSGFLWSNPSASYQSQLVSWAGGTRLPNYWTKLVIAASAQDIFLQKYQRLPTAIKNVGFVPKFYAAINATDPFFSSVWQSSLDVGQQYHVNDDGYYDYDDSGSIINNTIIDSADGIWAPNGIGSNDYQLYAAYAAPGDGAPAFDPNAISGDWTLVDTSPGGATDRRLVSLTRPANKARVHFNGRYFSTFSGAWFQATQTVVLPAIPIGDSTMHRSPLSTAMPPLLYRRA